MPNSSEWKTAKVILIHEKGLTTDTNNYRPISILPILSEIMERYVHTHFSHHLESHNLLTLMQSGFRKLHSTVTSLLHVTDKRLKNVDEGLVTRIIFIDLRKAFHIVSILILMKILTCNRSRIRMVLVISH